MKAIVQYTYGSSDVLRYEDIDTPTMEADDVLIRVHAASINAADVMISSGRPYMLRLAMGMRRPRNPVQGRDVAGRIDAVGSTVTRFRVGDEVYAEIDGGSFAEYAVSPERFVALKPANMSFEEAAAVPLAANTALQGLRDVAKLQPGQRVLVNGASGGVGMFAIQIAHALGAEVTGVCSARNEPLVRSIGADRTIDYETVDFTALAERYDVIVDLVGNRSLSDLRRVLTPIGMLVLSSGSGGKWLGPIRRILAAMLLSPFVSQRLRPLAATRSAENLATLRSLIETGSVTSVIERTYRLADTPSAIEHVAGQHTRGKVVVVVA